jgi:sec-independent protein translocase protein TatA
MRLERRNVMLDTLFTPGHLLVLFAAALLFFGGKKLPELGKGLREGLRSFREGITRPTEKP